MVEDLSGEWVGDLDSIMIRVAKMDCFVRLAMTKFGGANLKK